MGPVVKLCVYKAALALNDNKSVSITCMVAQVSGAAARSRGAALLPLACREFAAAGGGGNDQEQPQV